MTTELEEPSSPLFDGIIWDHSLKVSHNMLAEIEFWLTHNLISENQNLKVKILYTNIFFFAPKNVWNDDILPWMWKLHT